MTHKVLKSNLNLFYFNEEDSKFYKVDDYATIATIGEGYKDGDVIRIFIKIGDNECNVTQKDLYLTDEANNLCHVSLTDFYNTEDLNILIRAKKLGQSYFWTDKTTGKMMSFTYKEGACVKVTWDGVEVLVRGQHDKITECEFVSEEYKNLKIYKSDKDVYLWNDHTEVINGEEKIVKGLLGSVTSFSDEQMQAIKEYKAICEKLKELHVIRVVASDDDLVMYFLNTEFASVTDVYNCDIGDDEITIDLHDCISCVNIAPERLYWEYEYVVARK